MDKQITQPPRDCLSSLVCKLTPISLRDINKVSLMTRRDVKYVTRFEKMLELFRVIGRDYYVLEIEGERMMHYSNKYFDTSNFDFYMRHQHGYANLNKIRIRTYAKTHESFLEVKLKDNHSITRKSRMSVDQSFDLLSDEKNRAFLCKKLIDTSADLKSCLLNSFNRITLINKTLDERITIDYDLQYVNLINGIEQNMGNLVIIEVKRNSRSRISFLMLLASLNIRKHGFSKYCIGMALTDHKLPSNNIKRKIIEINNILKR